MEYGITDGDDTGEWSGIEDARVDCMPTDALSHAFATGAVHALLWQKRGEAYEIGASFVIEERRRALAAVRSDDKSYTSESRNFRIPVNGDGPIATSARTQTETVINDAANSNMKRAKLAKEFGIQNVHFVPCLTGDVLEFGTAPTFLSTVTKRSSEVAKSTFSSAKALQTAETKEEKARATRNRVSQLAITIGHGDVAYGMHRLKTWQLLYCGGTQAIVNALQQFSRDCAPRARARYVRCMWTSALMRNEHRPWQHLSTSLVPIRAVLCHCTPRCSWRRVQE